MQQSQRTSQAKPLTSTQIHNGVVQSYSDMVDVLHLNCLPVLGCIHTRTEWFMKRGVLERPPPVILPCRTKCHVCTGSCRKTFLPIIYSGAMRFMKSSRLTSKLPLLVTHENRDDLINTLWEDKDFCKDVFGLKNPTKGNVIGFFLQLMATKSMANSL